LNHKNFLASSLFVLIALTFLSALPCNAQIDNLSEEMQIANNAVEQAFIGILSAEKAGANVTGLLEELNIATELLAQANNSYVSGNLSAAVTYVNQVPLIAQEVTTQATAAKDSAVIANQQVFETTLVFIMIVSILFILSLFLGWCFFKRRYVKKMLAAKPEVISN
jgi:hypothetical protein